MSAGIPCPDCGHKHSEVIDTRPTRDAVKRRRECQQCSVRFTTYERVTSRLTVPEKDGTSDLPASRSFASFTPLGWRDDE